MCCYGGEGSIPAAGGMTEADNWLSSTDIIWNTAA